MRLRPLLLLSLRWAAALAILAPLVVATSHFSRLLRDPPLRPTRGLVAGATTPIGPLEVGDTRTVTLAPAEVEVRALNAFFATYYTRPEATFELCAGPHCRRVTRRIEDNSFVPLPLPGGVRAGAVTIRLEALSGGALAYWGTAEGPHVIPVTERSWSDALERVARAHQAQTGGSWWLLVGINAAVLAGLLALVGWRAAVER